MVYLALTPKGVCEIAEVALSGGASLWVGVDSLDIAEYEGLGAAARQLRALRTRWLKRMRERSRVPYQSWRNIIQTKSFGYNIKMPNPTFQRTAGAAAELSR